MMNKISLVVSAVLIASFAATCVSARELLQSYGYGPPNQSPTPTYSSPTPVYTPPAPSSPPPAYYPPYSYTPAPPSYEFEQWQKDAIAYVNKWYRWDGKWPLSWAYDLKQDTDYAATQAATVYYYPWAKYPGEYEANSLPPYGETKYKFVPSPDYGSKPGWQVAVDYWYNEGASYSNGYSAQTSNYTQLTWKASTGWWISSAKDQYNNIYYYAHYYAPGNVKGYYAENVPAYKPVTTGTSGK